MAARPVRVVTTQHRAPRRRRQLTPRRARKKTENIHPAIQSPPSLHHSLTPTLFPPNPKLSPHPIQLSLDSRYIDRQGKCCIQFAYLIAKRQVLVRNSLAVRAAAFVTPQSFFIIFHFLPHLIFLFRLRRGNHFELDQAKRQSNKGRCNRAARSRQSARET